MAGKNGNSTLSVGSGSLVDDLALSVISRISEAPYQRRNRRMDVGTNILISAVMARGPFDREQVVSDLNALRISSTDIVDHCIPKAAADIGAGWTDNTVSFATVSTATARLFGLCKYIGQEWDNIRPPLNARSMLLATVEREDHIIGPAVLADQLRRRGHSVKVVSNGTGESIAELLTDGAYDGLLVSVASLQALETTVKAIRHLNEANTGVPIILGGAVLGLEDAILTNTGADLVTNEIDRALDTIVGDDIDLRVAE